MSARKLTLRTTEARSPRGSHPTTRPVCASPAAASRRDRPLLRRRACAARTSSYPSRARSEEHTSELQSRLHLVCRLLLEKKIHVVAPTKKVSRRVEAL